MRPSLPLTARLHLRGALPVLATSCLALASPVRAATYTVTNLDDSGEGSLRWAIEQANATPEADDIVFGGLSGTILLNDFANPLPPLGSRTRILGETGTIRLHSFGIPYALSILGNDCVIRGLEIDFFQTGVQVEGHNNVIGGVLPGHRMNVHGGYGGITVRGDDNTITNCRVHDAGGEGIAIFGPSTGNFVGGTDLSNGNHVLDNENSGVFLFNDVENTTISYNVISGNGGAGLYCYGSDQNLIQFNIIGLDTTGLQPMGNGGGLFMQGDCRNNEILGNVISANQANGIYMQLASGNTLSGNSIGCDIYGVNPLPNGSAPGTGGIVLDFFCTDNVIGPLNTVVAHDGEGQFGVALTGVENQHNSIIGNRIGLDPTETIAIPNHIGVLVESANNTVGPLNVISGNDSHGIVVRGHPTTIVGNRIGTDLAGHDVFGNESGIYLETGKATIGGTESEGNIISGNRAWGIEAHAYGTEIMRDVVISGNLIGTGPEKVPLANGAGGVWLGANFLECLVGAESFDDGGRANGIAFNHGPGVRVGEDGAPYQASENAVLTSFFLDNEGKAIDLFASSPPGNEGVLPPVILEAGTEGASGTVVIPEHSTGGRIQLFYTENEVAQGTFEIGELDVTDEAWSYVFDFDIPSNAFVTATFTDFAAGKYRNTSEFSKPVPAQLLQVVLDIQPGSCTNPLASGKKGVIPAAIVGTAEIDVADIDPVSTRLEGVAPKQARVEDVAAVPGEGPCACTEEGPDGVLDLSLKFSAQALNEALGPVWHGDEKTLALTGNLHDGTPFEAADCVVIKGGMKDAIAPAPGSELGPGSREETGPVTFGIVDTGPVRSARQRITYALAEAVEVRIAVFDIVGRVVKRLHGVGASAGEHTLTWDSSALPSGIYFYRLEAGSLVDTRKLVLVR